jgi:putative tricarboxylic transport membrane protein
MDALWLIWMLKPEGMDLITGGFDILLNHRAARMTGLVPLVMGLFGISEVLSNLGKSMEVEVFKTKIKGLFPSLNDWKNSIGPISRGTILGFFLGLLPGGGAILASFTSYIVEKRVSKNPEKFGTGTIEGVAGPESANNAGASGNFIPLSF